METLGAARLAKEIPAQRAVATIVPREEITAALQDPEATPELFLRITGGGLDETDEANVIAMTWSRDDLEGLLERATGENVILTFDRDELSNAIGDVEAHGLRERALVFAVVATGALGSGAAIANAMPTGDDGGPVVTSVAPTSDAMVTDASTGGYAVATSGGSVDSMVTDAASGAGYAAPATAADSTLTDVSSAGGYAAPAVEAAAADTMVSDAASGAGYAAAEAAAADTTISDAASGAGYAAATTEAGSAADTMRTDASSSGGYGAVESTGSSGEFIGVHQPGTTDGLIAGGILLAIAGATFASRRGGTVRPA